MTPEMHVTSQIYYCLTISGSTFPPPSPPPDTHSTILSVHYKKYLGIHITHVTLWLFIILDSGSRSSLYPLTQCLQAKLLEPWFEWNWLVQHEMKTLLATERLIHTENWITPLKWKTSDFIFWAVTKKSFKTLGIFSLILLGDFVFHCPT